jgi:hypothetical protein
MIENIDQIEARFFLHYNEIEKTLKMNHERY